MSTSTGQLSIDSVLAQISGQAKYRDEFVRQIAAAQQVVKDTEKEITALVAKYNDYCTDAAIAAMLQSGQGLCVGSFGWSPYIVRLGSLQIISYSYFNLNLDHRIVKTVTICNICLSKMRQRISDAPNLNAEIVVEDTISVEDAMWSVATNPDNNYLYQRVITKWARGQNKLPRPITKDTIDERPGYYYNGVRVDI